MTGLAPWTAWVGAGLLLLAAEVLAPGFFLMWLGIAAIGAGLLTRALGLDGAAEVAVFAVLAAGSLAVGRLTARRPRTSVNQPGAGLVGRNAVAVGEVGATGRVRVGDSDWPARSATGEVLPTGAALRVVGTDGMVLVVDGVR